MLGLSFGKFKNHTRCTSVVFNLSFGSFIISKKANERSQLKKKQHLTLRDHSEEWKIIRIRIINSIRTVHTSSILLLCFATGKI